MATVLTLHTGDGEPPITGETVLRESAAMLRDYMRRTLPLVAADDPFRPAVEDLARRWTEIAGGL